MSSREFAEWVARERQEPRGALRADIQTALVASTIANAHRGKRRPFKLSDFILRWRKKAPRRQSVDEMRTIFKAFARTHNAILESKAK